ncbi:hypothetical protein GW796_09480 [archaeon]|nr:hypothetical protein [archaeon]
MKIHLDQIIDTVRKNLNSTNIILTGLEDHEKEVSSILHGVGLINTNTAKDIVVYGSCNIENQKLLQAKKAKIDCYPVDTFKNKFLFNHYAKNALQGKTILIDINLDYKLVMPIFLLNPKTVIWSNQINKKKAQKIDILISNEQNLDNIKSGLTYWLSDVEFEHFSFDGKTIEPYKK